MSAHEETGNHERDAAHQVMLNEIAWFETLDDETLQRIADAAAPGTPEHAYATAELRRRASIYSAKATDS